MELFADMEAGQNYWPHAEEMVLVTFELLEDGTKRLNTQNDRPKGVVMSHPTTIRKTELRAILALKEWDSEAIQKELSKYF